MLALDGEFLGLDIDVDRVDIIDATLLLSLRKDPVTEFIIDGVTAALAVLVVVVSDAELLLELAGELRLAGLDGLGAHIDGPVVILDLDLGVDLWGFGLHLLELIIAVGVAVLDVVVVVVVGAVLGALLAAALAVLLVTTVLLLGLAGGLALSLILLTLLGLVLQDEAAELQAEVDLGALAAGLAVEEDATILDDDVGLRILAFLAEDELVDEAVKLLLKPVGFMGAVDDPAVILGVHVGLGSELETEVLDDVCAGSGERLGNAGKIDNNGLDSITLAFNLGLQALHLVAIEGIAHIATNVDKSHDGGFGRYWFRI